MYKLFRNQAETGRSFDLPVFRFPFRRFHGS
jgi:hypothetical protein